METPEPVDTNYVGRLQEKCTKNKTRSPEYCDDNPESFSGKFFKCHCQLGNLKTEGIGYNKKDAKQISAKHMLAKTEENNFFFSAEETKERLCDLNVISKLNEYATKEKIELPLYAEKPQKDGSFVFSCTFNGFTSEGKGCTKKQAKENSADLVAKHFDIHNYFDNVKKSETRKTLFKTPVQVLNEYCQLNKLLLRFHEERISLTQKKEAFVVSCEVGDYVEKSGVKESKKSAKLEAASLMLSLLNASTPGASPKEPKRSLDDVTVESLDESPVKKNKTGL
uniref:DRBM domain-containing protein n=1 Tax=Graphocephala atropunctata TaxID=36148 RepID=A0A1B6LTP8_9HEMI